MVQVCDRPWQNVHLHSTCCGCILCIAGFIWGGGGGGAGEASPLTPQLSPLKAELSPAKNDTVNEMYMVCDFCKKMNCAS